MLDGVLVAPLNHALSQSDWARDRLSPYAGRSVRFEMPPLQLALTLDAIGYFAVAPAGSDVDVVITLPSNAPFLLLQGVESVMAAAHVEGNAEFATTLSFVLRNLRWDAEEDLSRLIGDIPAHRLMQHGRALIGWQQQAASHLKANVAEYLAHENTLLLTRGEFSAWRAQLDGFSSALDTIDRRIGLRAK